MNFNVVCIRRRKKVNFNYLNFTFQQYGTILDVEIIFNERGSKVSIALT